MILQQGKILSEMKKMTWDLDSTDTFIKKKITIVVFYNNIFWCVCVCGEG